MPVEFVRLLDEHQVCSYLNITPRQLRNMRDRKELPFVKVGGKCRYDKVDVDRYIRARKVSA